ncbi:MAG: hypothetical protein PWP67_1097, partial [Clostridium butyricum]|nr:hypothetical protein [Clostridium butyricum]
INISKIDIHIFNMYIYFYIENTQISKANEYIY